MSLLELSSYYNGCYVSLSVPSSRSNSLTNGPNVFGDYGGGYQEDFLENL
uniref:Uncharacterized protein n=1 Tax=Octopus bimaculoides TaxID=37653 RepID=A0A0L8IFP1_OCTBM